MSSVLVVVMVGATVAVIARATLGDGPKPATPSRHTKRQVPRGRAQRPAPVPSRSAIAQNDPISSPVGDPTSHPVPLRTSFGQRLRALALLLVTVLTLGSIAAALLGSIAVIAGRVVDRALG